MDPFTGGGAYVPPAASAQSNVPAGGYMDPFTGGGAYVPDDMNTSSQQSDSIALPAGLVYAPHRQYQGFEAVPDPGKVAIKIRELSAAVPPPNSLSPDELAVGGPIDDILVVCTLRMRSKLSFANLCKLLMAVRVIFSLDVLLQLSI
jgi:hypothetical protein